MSSRRKVSLQVKTAIITVLAFALGAGAYFLIQKIGDVIITTYYLSDENVSQREEECVDAFQAYVTENAVSSGNTDAVKQWCKDRQYVFVSLYKNNELYYETDGNFDASYALTGEGDPDMTAYLYPVEFRDGGCGIYVYEYSEERYYKIYEIAGLASGLAVLVLVILLFNGRIIMRVIQLSCDVKEVRDGNLKKPIECRGNDELAQLCSDADDMRISIIQHYESEQEAWKANNELLTSISHDIRTPLTALIGYSDLIADSTSESPETIRQYAGICREKAYQLKELTDTLFQYFLVFGNPAVYVHKTKYSAVILLKQLLGEHIIYLRQKGYLIASDFIETGCTIETDILLLKRVFDNLFANIEKYAAKDQEIAIHAEIRDGVLELTTSNRIAAFTQDAESTKIGVKTCEKLMELLGGTFESKRTKDTFRTVICLPVVLDK